MHDASIAPASSPARRRPCLLAPVPALVLGALLMHRAGVAPALWAQNLAAGLLLAGLCAIRVTARSLPPLRMGMRMGWAPGAAGALALLAATFFTPGIEGVHRWVGAGPVRLHAGAIALPVLILALGGALRGRGEGPGGWPVPLLGGAALALLAQQPDAAQATAFGGALFVLLLHGRLPGRVAAVALPGLAACIGWAWTRPDPLRPVRHVEGIVGVAAQFGAPWLLASVVSLILLPLPFLLARRENAADSPRALALTVYFAVLCAAPWLGAFPVPLLGFGLSPVVGYFVALGWLLVPSRVSPAGSSAGIHAVRLPA